MKKVMLIVLVLVSTVLPGRVFAAGTQVKGEISSVIVYRGQALVTRTIPVGAQSGSSELIVTGLPEKIVPSSLYSQGPENVKILSVRYREKAVREDTRQEVKDLDQQIEGVRKG